MHRVLKPGEPFLSLSPELKEQLLETEKHLEAIKDAPSRLDELPDFVREDFVSDFAHAIGQTPKAEFEGLNQLLRLIRQGTLYLADPETVEELLPDGPTEVNVSVLCKRVPRVQIKLSPDRRLRSSEAKEVDELLNKAFHSLLGVLLDIWQDYDTKDPRGFIDDAYVHQLFATFILMLNQLELEQNDSHEARIVLAKRAGWCAEQLQEKSILHRSENAVERYREMAEWEPPQTEHRPVINLGPRPRW